MRRVDSLFTRCFMTMCLVSICAATVNADPFRLLHQGRLLDDVGVPVGGTYELTYRIYTDSTGGTLLWEEVQLVTVTNGLYSAQLGSVVPLDFSVFDLRPDSLWLEIQVNVDPPLFPRTRLTATPLSAVSASIRGDIHSAAGQLFILDSLGDTTIYLDGKGIITKKPPPDGTRSILIGVADSVSLIRVTHTNEALGTGVIVDLVAGLPPGEPVTRTIELPPGRLSMDNVGAGGIDTTRMVEVVSYSDGGFVALYDSLGDTSVYLDGSKGGKVSLIGFGPFSRSQFGPGGLRIIDSLGDTTVIVDGANGGFIRLQEKVENGLGEVSTQTVVLDMERFERGTIGPGGSVGGSIKLGYDEFSLVDTTGDTVFIWDGDGNLRSLGKKGYDYYISKGEVGMVSNSGDSLWNVDSLGHVFAKSTIRIGASFDETIALNVAGDICYTGTIGACSDERYKKDITPLQGALETVSKLEGVNYNWRLDEFPEKKFSERRQIGLIAQDVLTVVPEVVSADKRGFYSIDYSKLTPLLLEAIKELKSENDSKDGQIEELRARVQKLEELVQTVLVRADAGVGQ